MARDRTFQDTASRAADFVFDEQVAEVFDDMAERSIRFYGEQQALIEELAARFYQPGTLQFVRPLGRDTLVCAIYDGLVKGGVLLVTEKILTNDSDVNRYFIDFYYEFKRRNGYSEQQVAKKREALENVLVPYRLDENVALLRRSGFEIVETFFQWYNFAGLMAVKKS